MFRIFALHTEILFANQKWQIVNEAYGKTPTAAVFQGFALRQLFREYYDSS